MPELPDILVYIDALEAHVLGKKLEGVRVSSPFLLRTAEPPLEDSFGQQIKEVRRPGKRITLGRQLQGRLEVQRHVGDEQFVPEIQWLFLPFGQQLTIQERGVTGSGIT